MLADGKNLFLEMGSVPGAARWTKPGSAAGSGRAVSGCWRDLDRGRLRDPVAAKPGAGSPGDLHGRPVHDHRGQHDHLNRAAVTGPGLSHLAGIRTVGNAELPDHASRDDPVVRGRPVRYPAHLPQRLEPVHRGFCADATTAMRRRERIPATPAPAPAEIPPRAQEGTANPG